MNVLNFHAVIHIDSYRNIFWMYVSRKTNKKISPFHRNLSFDCRNHRMHLRSWMLRIQSFNTAIDTRYYASGQIFSLHSDLHLLRFSRISDFDTSFSYAQFFSRRKNKRQKNFEKTFCVRISNLVFLISNSDLGGRLNSKRIIKQGQHFKHSFLHG